MRSNCFPLLLVNVLPPNKAIGAKLSILTPSVFT